MKKEFVGEIEKEGPQSPGPFSYRDRPQLGQGAIKSAMRPRLSRHGTKDEVGSEYYLGQEKRLPGPGYYESMGVTGEIMPSSPFKS